MSTNELEQMALSSSGPGSISDLAAEGGAEETADRSGADSHGSDKSQSALRWAISLQHLLQDSDGVRTFIRFLEMEGNRQLVDFHFARVSLKDPAHSQPKVISLIIAINKNMISGSRPSTSIRPWLADQVFDEIQQKLHRQQYTADIFDTAYECLLPVLNTKHRAFVQSDMYIEALDRVDSESNTSCSQSHSSCSSQNGDAPQTLGDSDLLDTLPEETPALVPSVAVAPPLPPRNNLGTVNVKRIRQAPVPLTRDNLNDSAPLRNIAAMSAQQKRIAVMPPNPYHTDYVPQLPNSVRDSAVSSSVMSSEADQSAINERVRQQQQSGQRVQEHSEQHRAYTNTQHAQTSTASNRRHPRHEQQRLNREANLHEKKIPRTTDMAAAHKSRVDPEKNQKQFHAVLCEKLLQWEREKETDKVFKQCIDKMDTVPKARQAVCQLAENMTTIDAVDVDECGHILDEHLGRIGWNDSNTHSPHALHSPGPPQALYLQQAQAHAHRTRSPGSYSPDTAGVRRAQQQAQAQSVMSRSVHGTGSVHTPPGTMRHTRHQAQRAQQLMPMSGPMPMPQSSSMSLGRAAHIKSARAQVQQQQQLAQQVQLSLQSMALSTPTTASNSYRSTAASETSGFVSGDYSHVGAPFNISSKQQTPKSRANTQPAKDKDSRNGNGLVLAGSSDTANLSVYYQLQGDAIPFVVYLMNEEITMAQLKSLVYKNLGKSVTKNAYNFYVKCIDPVVGEVYNQCEDDHSVLPIIGRGVHTKVVPKQH